MSKYNRKQKKVQEDQFLDFWERTYRTLEPYLRAIGITIGTAFVIWFAAWGAMRHYEHRAEAASEVFGRAVKIYDAELNTDENAAKPPQEEANPTPRFKSDKERADATLAELSQLEKTSGSGDIIKRATLLRAGVLYDAGKYEEAAPLFESFAKDNESHSALAALARESLGLCHEARGKLDEALAAYKLIAVKGGDFYRDRALYAQGRVLAKKGEKKAALEAFSEIVTKYPTSALKDEVAGRMQAIESTVTTTSVPAPKAPDAPPAASPPAASPPPATP